MPATGLGRAEVGCDLVFDVAEHVAMALQVAAASTAGTLEDEELVVAVDGQPVDVEEVAVDHGGRVQILRSGAGRLTVHYRALLRPATPGDASVTAAERLIALRQSRYCPSDSLEAFAALELGALPDGSGRGRAVGDWVFERIRYELGSSGPLDTAVETLLAGRGVCRDLAHLTVALCRALGVPARFASVYAPGLSPMDFHAVAEVAAAGRWEVVDATKLAPRQTLVRIATGRDAADTAFSTTIAGSAELVASTVVAVTDGDLPTDDHQRAEGLA
jgi:transglutaminase-like putative cysteine protease